MTRKSILQNIFIGLIFVCLSAIAAFAQTTAFNYQGKLTDKGVYSESSGDGINSYAGFFNGRTHVGNLEVQGLGAGGAIAVCYNSLKLLATCS